MLVFRLIIVYLFLLLVLRPHVCMRKTINVQTIDHCVRCM